MHLKWRIGVALLGVSLALQAGAGFAQSFDESLAAARSGDVFAQHQTGINYELGQGVPVDKKKAAEWYAKSVEGGLPWDAERLSEMYRSGDGVAKDMGKARYYADKAAYFASDMRAHPEKYAFIDTYLQQVEKDAVRDLLARAESGDTEAQRRVGENYQQGMEGFERNDVLAFKWYRKASDQGDAEAMYFLAKLLIASDLVAPELSPQATIDEAAKWMKQGIDGGRGRPQDLADVQKLTPETLKQLRFQNRLLTAESVLMCTETHTLPCSDDEKRKSLLLFKQAADDGDAGAQYVWANALLRPDLMRLLGKSVDTAAAMPYLIKASDADVPGAMMELAKRYEHGDGVEKSAAEAVKLYDRILVIYKNNNMSGGDGSIAECRLHYLRGDKIAPYQEENCSLVERY